ncbi:MULTISPECIES: secretion/conjugation apparatus DotM-related subunit [Achromobacter]|uniref:DotM C-terminal cytoplasmic domain-containing protein n=1 Tax=Achromobacter xylosoxidans (strain A8) TaxID=762376 RepID=E3HYK9_ACHXA|nr:hypothetical protein [Achromobacter xylosoxidans]ADP20163.1 hypothetical protein AXYL_06881 [Achromobacter xylosoxidans A8]
MARANGERQQDSIALWLLIGFGCSLILGGTLWLVASNRIVFYSAPLFHWLAKPWGWLPFDYAEQVAFDMEAMYRLARRYPTRIGFFDWLGYAHTAMRPMSLFLVGWVLMIGARLYARRAKSQNLQRKMTPDLLVQELMHFTTDIAPIACIQKQLVQNKLKRWRRQVSPMEVLHRAKVKGVPAIEPGMRLNEARLAEYLSAYTFMEVPGPNGKMERIRHNEFLGRQIVDLAVDSRNTERAFVDRMSSLGKTMFALLAPGAFNGAEGRADAEKVIRALNWSAYGSREGMARLDLPIVQEMYDKYREHGAVKQLLQMHHWEYTFLLELQRIAGRSSKIGSWRYLWLRPMDRILFFVLDTDGRHTPHSESAVAALGQHPYERMCVEEGMLPLCAVHEKDRQRGERGKTMPIIFVNEVVTGFKAEFDAWVNGVDDDHLDQMWKSKDIWRMARQALEPEVAPNDPPAEALTEDSEFDNYAAGQLREMKAAEDARLQDALAGSSAPGVRQGSATP